jgi:sRNA-binding regulator protein Hfq
VVIDIHVLGQEGFTLVVEVDLDLVVFKHALSLYVCSAA